jgi:hypothetical protein
LDSLASALQGRLNATGNVATADGFSDAGTNLCAAEDELGDYTRTLDAGCGGLSG